MNAFIRKIKDYCLSVIVLTFMIILLSGFLAGYLFCQRIWDNRPNVLPNPYRDWFITKDMYLDVNNDGDKERLVAITDKLWDMTSTAKVLILLDRNFGKQFIEVPAGYGASIIWWQAGDFNENGKMELAVQYDSYGSGNFLPWYLCEWDGQNFQVILQREEPSSKLIIYGVNDNFFIEIQHIFQKETGLGSESFKWDNIKEKYINY